MKKSIRNLVIGAAMAITALGASTAAFAGQYVQNDMNFRSGASTSAAAIGSVPAGAQVELIRSENGWDLVSYNGRTGYIHGGCSPIGMKKFFPTVVDISARDCPEMLFSGGHIGYQVEVSPSDLEKVIPLKYADIVE